MKSLRDQLNSARRALEQRRTNYPKMVSSGRMTHETATHEIGCFEGIVATLERSVELEEVTLEMRREVAEA